MFNSWASLDYFKKPKTRILKIEFCNRDIVTNCLRERSTSILHWGNNLWRNHAKYEKYNKTHQRRADHQKLAAAGLTICEPLH